MLQGINNVLVTVLAFIYVPLNLATSIFGMNIQQLNQNGQNLWVFFTTAVVALALTGGSWLCSKSTYEAVAWYKEMAVATEANDEEERKREYGLLLRMAMLIWLVRNGYKTWMWRSGAWIAILLDSKVQARGFSRIVGGAERAPRACDYVSEFSQWNEEEKHDIFGPEVDVTWSPLSQ